MVETLVCKLRASLRSRMLRRVFFSYLNPTYLSSSIIRIPGIATNSAYVVIHSFTYEKKTRFFLWLSNTAVRVVSYEYIFGSKSGFG